MYDFSRLLALQSAYLKLFRTLELAFYHYFLVLLNVFFLSSSFSCCMLMSLVLSFVVIIVDVLLPFFIAVVFVSLVIAFVVIVVLEIVVVVVVHVVNTSIFYEVLLFVKFLFNVPVFLFILNKSQKISTSCTVPLSGSTKCLSSFPEEFVTVSSIHFFHRRTGGILFRIQNQTKAFFVTVPPLIAVHLEP